MLQLPALRRFLSRPSLRRLLPLSLRWQFVLALSILAALILAGSLVAVYALRASAAASEQLAEKQLVHMQDAQDLLQHALLIERGADRMLAAATLDDARHAYERILVHLEAVDSLVEHLGMASSDTVVLDIHQAGQSFRNNAHIVAHLREQSFQTENAFRRSLRARTTALLNQGDPQSARLALLLYQLGDENRPETVAVLRKRFLEQARAAHHLPREIQMDLRSSSSEKTPLADDAFALRLQLLAQRASLTRFYEDMLQQAGDLVAAARQLSDRFTLDYRQAVQAVAHDSRADQHLVLALLAVSLALAWLVSRYFLGRHVLRRLQQVSDYLRMNDSETSIRIPVGGQDEIGEMARAVEQFVEDRRKLREAHRELEGFSYSVSHDLRSPLRAIDGFSHMLERKYGERLDDEARRYLSLIRRGSLRMAQLIDDILDFSRMSRREMSTTTIPMAELTQSVFEELRSQAPQRHIDLHLKPLPPARGDPAMVRQVLANLLSNAVKFTAPRAEAIIEVSGFPEGEQNVYRVKDNGVGFDMRYVDKLFGVFARLHREEEFEGTGIGLAIVKRVVVRHGGRVWAEAKPGEGTSLYFTLPAVTNIRASDRASTDAAPAVRHGA